jgi:hypothetical protein
MARKVTHNVPVFRGIALFIAVLAVFAALAALAQVPMTAAGQSSAKAAIGSKPQRLPEALGVGRVPVSRSRENRLEVDTQGPLGSLFLAGVSYYSGGFYATSVAVADVNGDGKLDVLAANSKCPYKDCPAGLGSVGVLLGNGDGTLQAAVTYDSGGGGNVSTAVADVNGDGKPDLVVANQCATDNCARGSVGILLGNGDGTFQAAKAYDSGASSALSVAVADVNGDGKPDLVVVNWGGENSGNGTVGVLLGNGDGTFQPAVTYDSGGYYPSSVAVADVNGDGKPDVVVANSCGAQCEYPGSTTVGVLLGNGDGTLQATTVYGSGGYYGGFIVESIAIADVNGDRKPDLLVTNECTNPDHCTSGSVGVLLGNGDGTFQAAVTYDSGGFGADSVAVSDVNGDNKADLLVANYCTSANCSNDEGAVGVLLGNGDGTFQTALTYDSGGIAVSSMVVGDINGDGRPDLAVANLVSSVGVLLNNTGPHTPTTTALVSNANPAILNQLVTYTATVTSQSGGIVGAVTFYDGSVTIATAPPVNNQAAYSTKYKKTGVHAITATYSGDVHNTGSTSATLTEYIEVWSKTVLTTSGSPSFVGQPVTFTAIVTSRYGTIPDGELVTFHDGTAMLGSMALVNGTAAYTTSSLSGKTHTIKATYSGDATFKPSTAAVTQVVNKYPTTTALSSNQNPSRYGQAVTFTATLTPTGPYQPTGEVKFMDGTTALGSATLSAGVGKLTKSKLVVGTHTITAQYLGDTASAKSTSSVLDQVVQ